MIPLGPPLLSAGAALGLLFCIPGLLVGLFGRLVWVLVVIVERRAFGWAEVGAHEAAALLLILRQGTELRLDGWGEGRIGGGRVMDLVGGPGGVRGKGSRVGGAEAAVVLVGDGRVVHVDGEAADGGRDDQGQGAAGAGIGGRC